MADSKEQAQLLGSKQMLRQSVAYLFNSYREQGYSASEAKQRLTKELEDVYKEYDGKNMVTPSSYLTDPQRIVTQALTEAESLYDNVPKTQQSSVKFIVHKLQTLNSIVKR